jgi:AraC-like DNA-binding protein
MDTRTEPAAGLNRPPFRIWKGRFSDFDEAAEEIQGFGLDWLQLDRGPMSFRFQQLGSARTLFTRLSVTRKVHQRCVCPDRTWTFAVIGRTAPNLEWNLEQCTKEHILLFPRNEEYQILSHPGNYGDTISIAEASLRSAAEQLGLPDPAEELPKGQAFLQVGLSQTEGIRKKLSILHSIAPARLSDASASTACSYFEDDLIAELLAIVFASSENSQCVPARWKRNRALHRALEFIEDHAGAPPTIADVCRAAGSSWRTLNYAFQERFGVTPKQYLQARRLRGVRKQLRSPEAPVSVSDAAARWGFWHMGKFAAEYRSFFGERPSDTLRRRVVHLRSG